MKKRLLSALMAASMVLTMVPPAFATEESPIPTEYLPKVQGFNYDANDGTASIRYTMKTYDDGDHYTRGYRALIWGNNGNRNNVFSGYLIEDDDAGTTAGDQKLKQELGMNFFDEPAAGYTPVLSSVVAFMSPEPLYTEQTGYGVNVALEDGIRIPTGVADFSGSGPIYGTTLGTGFEKGMYYLQIRHDGGVWFTATGSVSGPDDTLYVDGTTAGDISWAGKTPSIYNAPEVYFWRSTCTGVSSDGKTINFEVTKMQPNAVTPPEENEPEVTVEESKATAAVSADGISAEDKAALEAVLSNADVTGVKDALSNAGIDQIIQSSGLDISDDTEIKVQLQTALTVTNADLDRGIISFEAVPSATITAGAESKTVSIDNSALNGKEIAVKLPIPAGFDLAEILHISKGQAIEQYLKDDGFQINNNIAELTIKHFSELRMNETVTTVAKINGSDTGYFSLQSAIDAADSGDTISLYQNSEDTVIRIASKSLTIDCNTYTLRNDVDWQLTGCTRSEATDDAGHRIITITRTTGGGSSSGGGGGSSSGTNAVSVATADNGSVSVSPRNASEGATVTITVTPDAGYELDTLTVTDADGNNVSLTRESATRYTFTMPDSKVTVKATFTEITEQPADLPFGDIASSAWYAEAVRYVYENGMMNGTSANTFSPNATTNRAMIVTILYRLENEPAASASGFTDVAAGSYYADAVAWAAANGVINGVSETSFAPNAPVTREQLAAILCRYAQLKGYDVTASGSLNGYADASQTSSYAVAAMQWANAEGLISGISSTVLDPQGSATRAQVATILMRFCENIAQ